MVVLFLPPTYPLYTKSNFVSTTTFQKASDGGELLRFFTEVWRRGSRASLSMPPFLPAGMQLKIKLYYLYMERTSPPLFYKLLTPSWSGVKNPINPTETYVHIQYVSMYPPAKIGLMELIFVYREDPSAMIEILYDHTYISIYRSAIYSYSRQWMVKQIMNSFNCRSTPVQPERVFHSPNLCHILIYNT